MASEAARAWWREPRLLAAAIWIFGCAIYYYARFTWVFVAEHEDALRDLASDLAGAFALSGRSR